MYYYFYQVFMILSLIMTLFVAILTWKRRHINGAPAMIALASATFVWTLGFFLESHSDTLESQLLFNNIGYLGSMAVPVAWFVFCVNYTNNRRIIEGWKTVLFCIFPLIFTVFVWTNNMHHLVWSNEHLGMSGDFTVTIKTYGPLFWAALAYNYTLILVGGIVLLHRLISRASLFLGQVISLLVGICLPWIWNMIYVFNLVSLPRKDLTPVMFAISGLVISIGLVRYHVFTVIPYARQFIIQQMNEGVLVFNNGKILVEANPKALQILALPQSIIGKKLENLNKLSPVFEHLTLDKFNREEMPLTVAGEMRYFEVETVPMIDGHETSVGYLLMLYDITEIKQTSDQYRLVAEHTADVIYKLSIKDQRFTYISPSAKRVFGYTDKEALTMTPKDILTPDSYEKQSLQLMQDIQNGVDFRILQVEAIHKDGHIITIEIHGNLIREKNSEPNEFVAVARDITERKKMEEQLIRQDRLASIGQLTSGIAMEVNNPLTGIINLASLLLNRDLPEDIKLDLKSILEEAQRTARTVKNLLAFSRRQPYEKQLLEIDEDIRKVLELRAYEQKINNIGVKTHLAKSLPKIVGNNSDIQQMFFNIIINAEYFMIKAHGKGTLTISTEKIGDFVRITFANDGPAISAESMRHLFEPFYTTKEAGKGLGLGLSICHGIVTDMGGRIWAESQEGKGTKFIIELPVYSEPKNGN